MKRVLIRVTGRVQGVNFRYAASAAAERVGVTGWICNLEDGSVQALAEGDDAAVDAFVAWCRRGPPYARVEAVEVRDLGGPRRHREFQVSDAPLD
jgi:acylphosphatase